MQWLEIVLLMEAAGSFLVSGLNAMWLAGMALRARTRPRRVGVSALALVCGAMALEALLFLALSQPPRSGVASAATLIVRTTLLLSSALIASL
ncbi:MAG TPA: hypothetical protein VFY10_10295, partial [Dehalococcoidia bacterium]|nr:hypothetical protein [Dehalococcoidia bacterium]